MVGDGELSSFFFGVEVGGYVECEFEVGWDGLESVGSLIIDRLP